MASSLQEYADKRLHHHSIAGASIVVVEDGKLTERFVVNNDETKALNQVNVDSVFQVASISKPVTAWLALCLVRDGLISLDEPITNHLTRWQFPKGQYSGDDITLRQLLSHTAGLSVPAYSGITGDGAIPEIEASLNGQVARTPPLEIITQPGEQWAYSGGGYTLIQLLIEEVSGQSFSDYAQQKLFSPLEMNSSSFKPTAKVLSRLTQPHGYSLNPIPQHQFVAKAAAGLHTTAADLAKFALANLQDNPVLDATLKQSMHGPHVHAPFGEMSLGFLLTNNSELIGHTGGNFGWRAQFEFNLDRQIGLIAMTNSESGAPFLRDLVCYWAEQQGLEETSRACAESEAKNESSRRMLSVISFCLATVILLGILLLVRRFRKPDSRFSWPSSTAKRVAAILISLVGISLAIFLFTPLGAWIVSGGFTNLFATIHYLPIGSTKVAILGLTLLGLVVVRLLISQVG